MDRKTRSQPLAVNLQGFTVDAADLSLIKSWAVEEFTQKHGDQATAWVLAVDRYLRKRLNDTSNSSDKGEKG